LGAGFALLFADLLTKIVSMNMPKSENGITKSNQSLTSIQNHGLLEMMLGMKKPRRKQVVAPKRKRSIALALETTSFHGSNVLFELSHDVADSIRWKSLAAALPKI